MKKGLNADDIVGRKISRYDFVGDDIVIQFDNERFIVIEAQSVRYDEGNSEAIFCDDCDYWLYENSSYAVMVGLITEEEEMDMIEKRRKEIKEDKEEREKEEWRRLNKKYGK